MNRLVKHKRVHFDKEENSSKPLKWNELVLTSAFKLRVPLAGRMARWLPNLGLSFALDVGFTSFFLKNSFGNSDRWKQKFLYLDILSGEGSRT